MGRSGTKPVTNVPVFFDTNTPRPFIDPTVPIDQFTQGTHLVSVVDLVTRMTICLQLLL